MSKPYSVSISTITFLRSQQITWTMVSTTAQHSTFPASIAPHPYVVVTKCICKSSIYAVNWYQNMPHLPNISLASNLASTCLPNDLLIPDYNLSLWYCDDFKARSYNPLTPSWEFHNSGIWIDLRGVVYSFPSHIPPKIGGTYVLKLEIRIDWLWVSHTLAICN